MVKIRKVNTLKDAAWNIIDTQIRNLDKCFVRRKIKKKSEERRKEIFWFALISSKFFFIALCFS